MRNKLKLPVIVVGVVVLAALGFVGYRMTTKNEAPVANKAAKQQCEKENDKDLCKFIAGWKELKQFRLVITNTSEGKTDKSTFEFDAKNSHLISQVNDGPSYEFMNIGAFLYTKAADGTWWKQQSPNGDANAAEGYKSDFEAPSDTNDPAKPKYEKQGKEACGKLTCFKYKVTDPAHSGETTYIWFDDDDYLLRRQRVEGSDGSVSEQVFSYEKVKISEPSPVKELGPNQFIAPGQTEPITLPAAP
jgi:hypothetical protein